MTCPTFHKNDTHYVKHCVDCGNKVLEWEREWYPPDNPQRGSVVFNQRQEALGGNRCPYCHDKLQQFVAHCYYSESAAPHYH